MTTILSRSGKFLAQDIWRHLRFSIKSFTSLALSPFEAVNSNVSTQSVSRGFHSRCLRMRYFVVYGSSKLRRFLKRLSLALAFSKKKSKGRNGRENYFLTNFGRQAMESRSCKGHFTPESACETFLLLTRPLLLKYKMNLHLFSTRFEYLPHCAVRRPQNIFSFVSGNENFSEWSTHFEFVSSASFKRFTLKFR